MGRQSRTDDKRDTYTVSVSIKSDGTYSFLVWKYGTVIHESGPNYVNAYAANEAGKQYRDYLWENE